MNITRIYSEGNSAFGKIITDWAESMGVEALKWDGKEEEELEAVEGLLLFHENHDLDKAQHELVAYFEHRQRGISKIDINGTLAVAVSNFSLWMDRNRCKSILAIGSEELTKNPNLDRFLEQLKTA